MDIMKRFFPLLCAAALSLTLASCSDKNDGPASDGGKDKADFTVVVSHISATSCLAEITPADKDMPYCFGFMEKPFFDGLYEGNAERAFQVEFLNPWIEQTAGNPAQWENLVARGDLAYNTADYMNLYPDEEYVLLVAGVKYGVRTTPVAVCSFRTLELEDVVTEFTITENHGVLRIQPSTMNWYFWNARPGAEYLVAGGFFDDYTDEQIVKYYENRLGGQISSLWVQSGESFKDYADYLTVGNSYTVVAFVCNDDYEPTGKVERFTFTFEGVDRRTYTDIPGPVTFTEADNCTMERSKLSNVPNAHYWDITFEDTSTPSGAFCMTGVLSELGAETPAGHYEISLDVRAEVGYALAGSIAPPRYTYIGTWYCDYDESGIYYDHRAAADTGTVDITALDGGDFRIEVRFKDPRGNDVECLYTGPATIKLN